MPATFDDGSSEYTTPAPMGDTGDYNFEYLPQIARNGRGDAVTAQYSRLTWQWRHMSTSDYNWWCSTLLGGAASKVFAGGDTLLLNHLGTPTFVSSCVVYRPTHGPAVGAYFTNVQLEVGLILL